MRFFPR
jgi:hypothetical protein